MKLPSSLSKFWRRSADASRNVLFMFEEPSSQINHPFTDFDSFEGILILGGTGSGKSSGSGKHIACGLLAAGCGGFVTTAKSDDLALFANFNRRRGRMGYCARLGWSPADVIVVGPRFAEYESLGLSVPPGGHSLNVLDAERAYFEKRDPLSATQNVAYLCGTATEAANESKSMSDSFWADTDRQMITNAADLQLCATGRVSLLGLAEIIRTAPRNRKEAWSRKWREQSVFWTKYFRPAVERTPVGHIRHHDLEQAAEYWLVEFPELTERTRSIIVTAFMSKVTPLLRGSLRPVCAGERPDTFDMGASHLGKIIIVDLPIMLFGQSGRFAQLLLKTFWQRCAERRDPHAPGARPVFLWMDEGQLLVTKHDSAFAQLARSQRVATVLLSQNISNFYATMAASDARAATDSLLGNLQTKIFHSNGDAVTNEWAERHFAKELRPVGSTGMNSESVLTHSVQQSLQPIVLARNFTTLRKGGARNDGIVDAIVFQTGRCWDKTGRNHARIVFRQELESA